MKVSASLLSAEDRKKSVLKLNKTGVSYIHIDVMDGNFVPNIQFLDMNEIMELARISKYPLDVHLMVDNPLEYIDLFREMNIWGITFHLEVEQDILEIVSKIRGMGYRVGISIKPNTDVKKVVPYLKDIDLVLVMSVEPGYGGQSFLIDTVSRVQELKQMIEQNCYAVQIEVDGGINDVTIRELENVDIAVVGSYITGSDNYHDRVCRLLEDSR